LEQLSPAEVAFVEGLKKSPNDFDCLPLRHQVAKFIHYLQQRGDTTFTIDDLRALFSVADMKAPRTRKPLRPAAGQLKKVLEALERAGTVGVRRVGNAYELR